MKKLIAIILILTTAVISSGCDKKNNVDAKQIVGDTLTVFNARYTGYTDDVENAIDRTCSQRISSDMKSSFEKISKATEKSVIDVTELVINSERLNLNQEFLDDAGNPVQVDTSKLIDEQIEKDGERYIIRLSSLEKGIDICEVVINGQEYDVDVSHYKRQLIDTVGDKSYEFTMTKYILADGINDSRVIIIYVTNEFGESYKLKGGIDDEGKVVYSDSTMFTDCDIDTGTEQ